MKSPWPRRIAWVVAGLALAALALAGLIFANLNGLARRVIIAALERQTGSGVRLDAVRLGTRDSSLLLQNLVMSNPPGFSSRPLLALPELYLAYDPESARSNALKFREVRLHLSELNLEVNREGQTNLMALAATAGEARGWTGGTAGTTGTNLLGDLNFQGVDRLTLTLGRIRFRDERDPSRNLELDLGITNRSLLQVRALSQLLPLALEIAFKGGLKPGQLPVP